jgi:hypothetical protein
VTGPGAAAGADGQVTVATAVARSCQAGPAGGAPGTVTRELTPAQDGFLRTSLTGAGPAGT